MEDLRVKFGIWHDRVTVYFRDQPTQGYEVELDREAGTIHLYDGNNHASLHREGAEELTDYPWRLEDHTTDRDGFARCALMEMRLRQASNGLYGELPLNHELPWPHVRICEGYDTAEELMQECRIRRQSAKVADVRVPPPPSYTQCRLTREMRLELFA